VGEVGMLNNRDEIKELRALLASAEALLESMRFSVTSHSDDIWRYSSFKTYIRKYNQIVQAVMKVTNVGPVVDLYDLDKVPGHAASIPAQQKDLFDSVFSNLSILKSYLENKLGLKQERADELGNFIQSNLRRALHKEPEKEIEVQNALETLLIGKGMQKGLDYDRETGRVKVSVKEVVPDFVFPRLNLALEVKLSKTASKPKELVDEINADTQAYGKQYSRQLFVVYDLGTIRDEVEFRRDLASREGVSIIIVKH
jgi:hypothetical protein